MMGQEGTLICYNPKTDYGRHHPTGQRGKRDRLDYQVNFTFHATIPMVVHLLDTPSYDIVAREGDVIDFPNPINNTLTEERYISADGSILRYNRQINQY